MSGFFLETRRSIDRQFFFSYCKQNQNQTTPCTTFAYRRCTRPCSWAAGCTGTRPRAAWRVSVRCYFFSSDRSSRGARRMRRSGVCKLAARATTNGMRAHKPLRAPSTMGLVAARRGRRRGDAHTPRRSGVPLAAAAVPPPACAHAKKLVLLLHPHRNTNPNPRTPTPSKPSAAARPRPSPSSPTCRCSTTVAGTCASPRRRRRWRLPVLSATLVGAATRRREAK